MKYNFRLFRVLISSSIVGIVSICSPIVSSSPPFHPNLLQQGSLNDNLNIIQYCTNESAHQIINNLKLLISNLELTNDKLNVIDHYSQNVNLEKYPDILGNLKNAMGLIEKMSETLNNVLKPYYKN